MTEFKPRTATGVRSDHSTDCATTPTTGQSILNKIILRFRLSRLNGGFDPIEIIDNVRVDSCNRYYKTFFFRSLKMP